MERLARLQARIAGIADLLDVVKTMRALAAVRMHQAEEALHASRRYAETVEQALAEALALDCPDDEVAPTADAEGPCALMVFATEHGFVGALNRMLIESAESATAASAQRDLLFVIGSRGALAAREAGLKLAWTHPSTTRKDGVPVLARTVAAELYRRLEVGEIRGLDMLFARISGIGRWQVERRRVLPLDVAALRPAAAGPQPLHHLDAPRLIERLIEEHVFAQLAHGVMEAHAGENAARVAAMTAAHDNIENKLHGLRHQERQLRQEEITTELLDVVVGSEALSQPA